MARFGDEQSGRRDGDVPGLRVFGEPTLRTAGGEVTITGHAARILAALVARRSGLSIDDLTEVLWPADPPTSARSALHVHLSRLRKILEAVDEPHKPRLERRGQHYVVGLDGVTVDVDLFESLRRRALPLVGADPTTALDLIEQALALAVAPAFTIDGESVDPTATDHLNLALLDLGEEHVECLIALGRFLDAERAGLGLVDAEPYRERRWALVMRAQGLHGRRHDALATFRRARVELVNGLGIEPGVELQRIQLAVLAGDDQALAPARQAAAPAGALPPPTLGPLVGRDRELLRVERVLSSGAPLVLLGAPGVGKTRLASEVCFRAAETEDVNWIDLRSGPYSGPTVVEETINWARRSSAGLMVLDNAEADPLASCEIVAAVRRVAPRIKVLVTSRTPIGIEAATESLRPFELPALSTSEPAALADDVERSPGVQLLRMLVELRAPAARIDSSTAAAMVEAVGGLPLGIRLVADLARSMPAHEIVDRSRSSVAEELRPAVEAVLEQLGPSFATAFAALSIVPGQIDRALIDALLAVDDPDPIVTALCDGGLLQFDATRPESPYSLLEPLRDVGAALLDASGERSVVVDRFVAECVRRSRLLRLPTTGADAMSQMSSVLDRELPWHRQAIALLAETKDDRPALRIVRGLELPLYTVGRWSTLNDLVRSALAIDGPPSVSRALAHVLCGRPGLLHQTDEGELAKAMEMATGEPWVQARALCYLGMRLWWEHRDAEALATFAESRRLAVEAEVEFSIIEADRFAGAALVTSGEGDAGIALQFDVLTRVEQMPGMEALVPHLRMYLGHSRRHLGDVEGATTSLESARVEYERASNTASLIHVCAGLAELAADVGDHDAALRHAARGLELAVVGGLRVYDGWLACTLARVHAARGDIDAARAAAGESVAGVQRGWVGEAQRVAAELASVALSLGEEAAAARLVGLADATPDRRDLPFVGWGERARLEAVRAAVADGCDRERKLGATSTLPEAAALLIHPRRTS